MRISKAKSETSPRSKRRVSRNQDGVSAGAKIIAAISEATEILRSEGLESKQLTIRTYKLPSAPRIYRPADVKRVRQQLGASQAVLAGLLGVNVNTVRSWEQGKRPPQPIACRFLSEIESDIAGWRRRILHQVSEIEPSRRPGR